MGEGISSHMKLEERIHLGGGGGVRGLAIFFSNRGYEKPTRKLHLVAQNMKCI